jgi:hypothetical protein
MKKLLFVAGAALAMAACSEAPTAPSSPGKVPSARPSFDLTCKSGYVIAYDEGGNAYCAPDSGAQGSARPTSGRP